MKGVEALELVSDIASQQWGLLTSAQAKDYGVDLPSLRRLEKQGALIRIRHGVYATASTILSTELEIRAHWLALRPELMAADRIHEVDLSIEAIVSHTTAADLWGIGDLWPNGIHFTVSNRRRTRQSDVQFHTAEIADSEWEIHPTIGIPITTVARTIADLARAGHEQEHLLGLVGDAGQKSLLDLESLLDSTAGLEGAFGAETGDRLGLKAILSEHLPMTSAERQTRSIVEEALAPLRSQLAEIAQQQMPHVLEFYSDERALQIDSLLQALPKGVNLEELAAALQQAARSSSNRKPQ